MDKDLLIEQLRERYNANPEDAIQLLLEHLEKALYREGPEALQDNVVELLTHIPEAKEGLFDDEDMINCVGEE